MPRITIKSLLVAVAVVAVDCFLVVEVFAGVFLPIVTLNYGLIRVLRRDGQPRRFWVGFEVVGLLALGVYAVLAAMNEELFTDWPSTVIDFVAEHLPPAGQAFIAPLLDRFLALQDDPVGVYVMIITLFESTIGLPLVLLATIGGWTWKSLGTRPISESGLVENPSSLLDPTV